MPMRVLARMLNDPQHPHPPITQSHPLRIHKRHLLLLQPSRACHHCPKPQNPISHEISSGDSTETEMESASRRTSGGLGSGWDALKWGMESG
ncbi:hypothetical protein M422DRAFT_36582, partial [Sphaerobolus stellatus SS14]